MTSPFPSRQYLVAFNNGPNDDPALITAVAAPGTVGAVNVWTDITTYGDSHHIVRGRQHEFTRFEAGTCDLILNNQDARFNPWNTTGPYFGLLKPRKLLQVRATWNGVTYIRFTGHVNAWPVHWMDDKTGVAEVQAADAFRMFQGANVTTTGYPTQVVADGAVHYWRFNDPVGSTQAANSVVATNPLNPLTSGIGFTGATYTWGSTSLIPVDPASSIQMHATAGGNAAEFVPLASTVLVGDSGITSELLVEIPATFTSDSTITVQIAFTIAGVRKLLDVFMFGSVTGNVTTVQVQDGTSGGALSAFTVPNLSNGNPHHVLVTLSGAYVANVYVDGVNYGSHTFAAFNTDTLAHSTEVLVSAGASADETINVQEWALYQSVLSAGAVANHYTLASLPQQSTDARIGRILNVLGWSAGARSIDVGSSNVQAVTSSLVTTSSLAHMQDCETTEAGAFYMTNDGKARFISRHTMWTDSRYQTSQATFGDALTGEIAFQPSPLLALDDIDIYNEATGQRQGGLQQITTNTTSIGEYGRKTWQPNGTLLGVSDSEVLSRLQAVLHTYAEPVTRLSSIVVDLVDSLSQTSLVAQLLALELLYNVVVNRHTVPGGGTAFTQTGLVERIEEQADANSWVVTLALDPADTATTYFQWGSASSTWGGTAVWGF